MNTRLFESWAEDILAYALVNWDSDGWDYIYECHSVDDIVDLISSYHDYDSAFNYIASIALDYEEARNEVRAEIF